MKTRATCLAVAGAIILAGLARDTYAQGPLSNRCFTPQFWCYMQQVAPVGTRCFCGTPYGPVQGIVR